MDLLSDVLRVVRLTGGIFFTARLSASWSFRSPPAPDLARALGFRANCLALFHILAEGRCWIELDRLGSVELEAGTVVVLPHAHAHVLTSRPGLQPRPLAELLGLCTGEGIPRVSVGRGDEACRFICGFYACDQSFNPLIGALPTLLLASRERGLRAAGAPLGGKVALQPGSDDRWLGPMLDFAVQEADAERPGSPAMLARLSELMFVGVLRQYVDLLPAGATGWLAAVRHPQVGRALRLLHREPQRSWTVEELARAVWLSRSALSQSFTESVGEPPMQYLTRWRMHLAQQLLKQPELSVSQVAARVGYSSEVAFHRAFKRHVGLTPASWRADTPSGARDRERSVRDLEGGAGHAAKNLPLARLAL